MNQEDLELEPQTGVFFDEQPITSPKTPSRELPKSSLQLHYQVEMPEPEAHLFEVTLQIRNWHPELAEAPLDIKMPVWTPGSYLVREYARHVQNLRAIDATGAPLDCWKVSKNHWQIDPRGRTELTLRYQVYANELTVRTNHLDSTHGYFNGAALFFYVPEYEKQPITITIVTPNPNWQVFTPLPPVAEASNTFQAEDFDTLVDSPFEIGEHQLYHFNVLGKPHSLAVWGQGNLEADRVIADMQRIIEVEAKLFGGLPYDRYLFLLHLAGQGFGGLEHKFSCSLIYQRFGFRIKDRYDRFMQLVAHEFFHLWNVKRIRPKALEVFDYDNENYTPSLWFSEGTTSFYDLIIPYRAKIYSIGTYLNALSREISRYMSTPGRRVQPLSESSFDAWIKLYRPDANSSNSQISYYLKGEMVSLLLDLLIRARHDNRRSLDDVMRQMWEQYGKEEIGFTPQDLEAVVESVAGTDLTEFFNLYLHGTDELPFDQYLAPFGLKLQADGAGEDGVPYTGLMVKTEAGREMVKFVEAGSPAQKAGLDAGDELLALNGIRVTAEQLNDRLRDFAVGNSLEVTFFHQDELRSTSLTLAPPRPTRYQIVAIEHPSRQQEQNFAGWLGVSLEEIL